MLRSLTGPLEQVDPLMVISGGSLSDRASQRCLVVLRLTAAQENGASLTHPLCFTGSEGEEAGGGQGERERRRHQWKGKSPPPPSPWQQRPAMIQAQFHLNGTFLCQITMGQILIVMIHRHQGKLQVLNLHNS